VDLDHVALATADATPALATLVGELGATVLSGGQFPGFRPVQVRVGDAARGMTVELLEPWDAAERDFLARFLARHGDGPHHLTVKVDDFDAALDAVRSSGRTPVQVDRSDPHWLEAFVAPPEAFGTVVQLAAQDDAPDFAAWFAAAAHGAPVADPAWWPELPPPAPTRAVLRRVVLRTPSRSEARAFFGDLLGGREVDGDGRGTELVWPGGGRLRLEDGAGPPGIDRLELDGPGPARTVAGVAVVGAGSG
jgi:catechol 2,3-dioxygenase-like lactoylglutathione lyase family enzyme